MLTTDIKIDIPYVNMDNVEIESQLVIPNVTVSVTLEPLFFLEDLEDFVGGHILPAPAGIRETNITNKLGNIIVSGMKSSITSINSAFSLLSLASPIESPKFK